jgi:presenilin-like A22 family membrane protease
MDQRTRACVACGGIVAVFVLVQVGALALVGPFDRAGYQAVEDPQNPTNSLVYLGVILVATAVMLAIIKLGVDQLLRVLLVGAGAYIALFVFRVILPPVVTVPVGGAAVHLLAWGLAGLLGVALWVYPEWYVIDAAGVVMGVGAAGMFGISFGVLPALLLLTVLAVYDAISVYGTEHMLTLASGVMEMKVPIVLVVPLSLSYSYLDADTPDPVAEDEDADTDAGTDAAAGTGGDADVAVDVAATANGGSPSDADPVRSDPGEADAETSADADAEGDFDRDALFIGLGDAVIPTVLVASAAFFAPESVPTVDVLGLSAALPAWTAMVGTVAGLVVLLWMVLKGRAHAGLPLLNGGTIAGYLVGALAAGLSLAQALGVEGLL